MSKRISILVFIFMLINLAHLEPCEKEYYNYDSFVCMCNSTQCGFPGPIIVPTGLNYTRYVTSKNDYRFEIFQGVETTTSVGDTLIVINHDFEYNTASQIIRGFGSSFTDSAGLNVNTLPEALQDTLLRSYFSKEGLGYNLARVPIAGSDFSTRPYSYDDDRTGFNLTMEDFTYKIPHINTAMALSEGELRLFGSPWSPPPWMKTNNMHNESGVLNINHWQTYADYLVTFLDEYAKLGINFWGITPQNEPFSGFLDWGWNTCGWTEQDMRDWIKMNFGPTLRNSSHSNIALMIHDQNRDGLPQWPATVLSDPEAAQYVSGTAVHWYTDSWMELDVMDQLHSQFPEKFMLYTEGCSGWENDDPIDDVKLGYWPRFVDYAQFIMEDLQHYSTGWVDWNLALDTLGGPNWADNYVDAPIIIDAARGVFFKQPTYYAMGHYSKFIERDAARLSSFISSPVGVDINAVAYHNPSGMEVIVILNKDEQSRNVSIQTHEGLYINIVMEPASIESIIYL